MVGEFFPLVAFVFPFVCCFSTCVRSILFSFVFLLHSWTGVFILFSYIDVFLLYVSHVDSRNSTVVYEQLAGTASQECNDMP